MTKGATSEIPLNISGLPTIRNRGALAWHPNGLVAVGSGTDILITDALTLNAVQVINTDHKSSINRVIWNPYTRQLGESKNVKYHADLVSTDTLNNIMVWDLDRSHVVSSFAHPESRQLLDAKWARGPDAWKQTKLFLLYSSNLLVIHDITSQQTFQNVQIMEPMSMDITSFDLDPYAATHNVNIAMLAEGYAMLSSFDPMKADKIVVNITIPLSRTTSTSSSSSSLAQISQGLDAAGQPLLGAIGKKQSSSSSIRKLVSDIIVGPENPLNQVIARYGNLEYLPSMKNHMIVWTPRELYLINTQFHVVMNVLSLEKSLSSLISIIPCKTRPALFTLHENGMVFLRKYVIANPHHSHTSSMSLETVCANENPRLNAKKSEVLGGAVNPSSNESEVLLYLSDGRFIKYSLVPGQVNNLANKAISQPPHQTLPTPITPGVYDSAIGLPGARIPTQQNLEQPGATLNLSSVLKGLMEATDSVSDTPSEVTLKFRLSRVTTSVGQITCLKNLKDGCLIAGTATGHVVLIKVDNQEEKKTKDAISVPRVVKKFAVHSNSPVNGIEVISETEVITWANLSFSANPKCELCVTEVEVGVSKMLKQDEPSHINTVKLSPLKQYFIIVYKNGSAPCELWDLPRKQLIKLLPSKLPPITCVQWKQPSENTKEETFFLTDLGTFLFTFRVDGNRFSNATCVKLDTGNMGGIPVALFTKGNLLFRADSSGSLVIYNTDKKTASPGVTLGRGPLFKILEFGDYFIAQFSDQIELWEVLSVQKIRTLNTNKLKSTDIAILNSNVLAVLVKNSGGLKFLPFNLAASNSGDWYPTVKRDHSLLTKYPLFSNNQEKSRRLVHFIKDGGKDASLFLEVMRSLSFDPDEIKLWQTFVSTCRGGTGAPVDPDVFCDPKVYKDTLVKVAECVWSTDPSKREEVGRTLILAGETEKSAEILLDTDPTDSKHYIANGLKAAISVGCQAMPESSKAVLKIVATNLIASGKNDEGLELLCMLKKHSEACKYIEASNDWEKAMMLCKTSLGESSSVVQGNETMSKYAQYQNSNRYVYKAACLFVFIHKYDRAIEVLFGARKRHSAYMLLRLTEENNLKAPVSDHIKLAIKLDFARFLFDMGLGKEAIEFCDNLGKEGKDVKAELEILSS